MLGLLGFGFRGSRSVGFMFGWLLAAMRCPFGLGGFRVSGFMQFRVCFRGEGGGGLLGLMY